MCVLRALKISDAWRSTDRQRRRGGLRGCSSGAGAASRRTTRGRPLVWGWGGSAG